MRVLLALTFACSGDPAGIRDIEPSITRTLPALEKGASVLRAENDIAHVYAESILDLHRVQGFVMAQDRYVQIELTRRFGGGTLAEVLGDLGVEIDATARGQGMRFVADRIWAAADDDMRARFEAFAEGVNAYAAVVKRGQLPVPEEIEIVAGLQSLDNPADAMQPMTGYDVAAVAAVLMSRLGYEATDLDRAAIAESLAALPDGLVKAGLIEDVFLEVSPVHAIAQTTPGATSQGLSKRSPAARMATERTMLERTAKRASDFARLIGKTQETEFGSNAWAVSSGGTKGQGAILANDGHLPLTIPSLFYQMCTDAEYFGDQDYRVCGLFFPGFPFLAVGTNGHVAWGQTYLDGDVVDFYREEIRLGPDGFPAESLFMGEWRPMERIDETYKTPGGEEIIPRFVTFDGRFLTSLEGTLVEPDAATGPIFFALGDWIEPKDVNADSVIEGISFDWTAFDMGRTLEAVRGFSGAESIADFEAETHKLVGYAQNIIVADERGDVLYTAYHALPCRTNLERDGDRFAAGADPQQILDGTKYGGFEIQLDPTTGHVREDSGCVVPFDVGPRVKSPAANFVATANHDPLGNGFDGSLANDPWYIGGPYDLGYRARTVEARLKEIVASGANIESMAELQADHKSSLGEQYAPMLVAVIATSTAAGFSDVKARLEAWLARGAQALSGVDTFYATYDAAEKKDAVATMIFNAWLRRWTELIFDEDGASAALSVSRSRATFRAVASLMDSRGENRSGLASYDGATQESALFDRPSTQRIETSDELMRLALTEVLEELASSEYFGTTDMDAWLWGLEHQVHFKPLLEEVGADNPLVGLIAFKFGLTTKELPLAPDLSPADPRSKLVHFPRDGDWFGVDAANPGLTRRPFTYSDGPVLRMVIQLDDGEVTGQNILPGGQSGLIGDPHFGDQAALWLENRAIPLRFFASEAVEGATSREAFVPMN